MKIFRQLSILGVLLPLICTPVVAQTVYKSTDKKATIYSDKPPKSGNAEQITIDPNQNVISTEKTPEVKALEEQQKSHWDYRDQQQASEGSARQERIARAEAELADAEAALEAGQQTQPGDFIGRKDGGVRPTAQRSERINALMDAVEQAKENLERAKYSREP
ncbi:MAG: DUF4124 domain-containing protein [Spongiibacteraceae bacterium]